MTKLEIWLREHELSPEDVAKEARVSSGAIMKYVTGESMPTSPEMTRITQACRKLSKADLTKRDLFDLPPVDMDF